MKWFRMYHEARTDGKLESLNDSQFRVWFRLMCFANEQTPRGVVPTRSQRLLAVEIARGDVDLMNGTLLVLAELEIIGVSDEEIRILHWDKRQFESDHSTNRWRKWKDKQDTNVGQTLVQRQPTPPDTDPDTDTEKRRGIDSVVGRYAPYGFPPGYLADIHKYMDEGIDLELLTVAFERAKSNPKTRQIGSYVAGTLRNWLNQDVRTVSQLEASEARLQIAVGVSTDGRHRRDSSSAAKQPVNEYRRDTSGAY